MIPMIIVDEIQAKKTAKKLKGRSPKRGKILLELIYQAISDNGKDYDSAFQDLGLTEQDILYPIFNDEVRVLMKEARVKDKRLLLLEHMMAVF